MFHHGEEMWKEDDMVPLGEEDVVHHEEEVEDNGVSGESGDVVHHGGEEEKQVFHGCLDVLHLN